MATTLEDYCKFTKTIYKNEDNSFMVKQVINLSNYMSMKSNGIVNTKYRSPLYVYDIMDNKIKESRKGLGITTNDCIQIANNKKMTKEELKKIGQKFSPCITIETSMFSDIIELLQTGEKWLCDSKFEKLFKFDDKGNTIGLSDENKIEIAKSKTCWLAIKPAVIFLKENVGVQSIFLKCDRGPLGFLTGEEYLDFVNLVIPVMKNFHQCGLELYNAGILSIILGGNTK